MVQVLSWLPIVIVIAFGVAIVAASAYQKGRLAVLAVQSDTLEGRIKCHKQFFPYLNIESGFTGPTWTTIAFWTGVGLVLTGLLYGRVLTSRADQVQDQESSGIFSSIGKVIFGRGGADFDMGDSIGRYAGRSRYP